jgi:hypothetical protein
MDYWHNKSAPTGMTAPQVIQRHASSFRNCLLAVDSKRQYNRIQKIIIASLQDVMIPAHGFLFVRCALSQEKALSMAAEIIDSISLNAWQETRPLGIHCAE